MYSIHLFVQVRPSQSPRRLSHIIPAPSMFQNGEWAGRVPAAPGFSPVAVPRPGPEQPVHAVDQLLPHLQLHAQLLPALLQFLLASTRVPREAIDKSRVNITYSSTFLYCRPPWPSRTAKSRTRNRPRTQEGRPAASSSQCCEGEQRSASQPEGSGGQAVDEQQHLTVGCDAGRLLGAGGGGTIRRPLHAHRTLRTDPARAGL